MGGREGRGGGLKNDYKGKKGNDSKDASEEVDNKSRRKALSNFLSGLSICGGAFVKSHLNFFFFFRPL